MPQPSPPTPTAPPSPRTTNRPRDRGSDQSAKRGAGSRQLRLDLDVDAGAEISAVEARLQVTDRLFAEGIARRSTSYRTRSTAAPHLASAARTLERILVRRQPEHSWVV